VTSLPASESIPLACPYCEHRSEVSAALAGCVTACPQCGRDVLLAPEQHDYWAEPPPPRRSWKRFTPLAVAIGGILGALVGALLLMIPMWFYALSVIGLGVRHTGIAGIVGAAIGALLGGVLGHRLCQE
jgi:hypothetical protein